MSSWSYGNGRDDDGDGDRNRGGDNYRDNTRNTRHGKREEGRYSSRSFYRNNDTKHSGNDERHNRMSETMYIPLNKIGLIIGKGGANVKRLQEKFKVNLKLDRNNGSLHILSDEKMNIDQVIGEINEQINNNHNDRRPRAYGDMNDVDAGNADANAGSYKQNDFANYNPKSNNNYDNKNEHQASYSDDKNDEMNGTDNDESPIIIDWDNLNKKADEAQKQRWGSLPKIRKDFYNEAPEVAALTAEEAERIRIENNQTVVARGFESSPDDIKKDDIPNPIWKFEQCFQDFKEIMLQIEKQNFEKPTPIQAQAWPILLKGNDMIGIAQTGTGKTLAFLLPAMIHTEFQEVPRRDRSGPTVLVLAPTRELALQIKKEVNKYEYRGMEAVCVYGGGDRVQQQKDCLRGCDIIICTPGRLNDFVENKIVQLSSISFLILDEADRMLDMGFEPQIRKVLLDIRPDRQTVMTSATWPAGVRRLAKSYMKDPITVSVGSLDLAATHSVTQVVLVMNEEEKFYTARKFVKDMKPNEKVIIFCGKKVRADDLSSEFTLENIRCQSIHGNRDQRDREQAIADISSGLVQILIATDVASRGLDIDDVTHVINFDFPQNIEEYVHRVGRTGRAGRTGTSISYVTRDNWGVAAELINILEEADQEVPPRLREMAERFQAMRERRKQENDKQPYGRRSDGGGFDRRSSNRNYRY